ncbi:probable 2-oxoglutarate dehydrogenase E1 component DHKTD1 homolog, mitochondrial [Harpegnathos saltator]|uniref:Probable 2-oxoglutarate dehydrogenase E1 component DHKTD1-like protein, mitochondrial n=1 Tax=Harpegnathos saltator TaxID=610380 RepID=E2BWB8_HARSA|nr:probable 2-oxoglutarate dehydrogenase E1 component DHKTD1 homolog, mitochondrial [Harpegnathos saltator]XP_025160374.1 probable 2-oxoglutarate dehydrogenase E1 component DHKTD1 homolog, mitochondrial [Harpegnathos saltator]EFN80022.1 Probable 2-oxoglutarate dehydrogenase E1 component DHKTD1-like protein, mitochondrial [Harpegnathos saltator]
MYAIGRFVLKKRSPRFWLTSSIPCGSVNLYHSENGVYGYKPSQRRHFEVPKEYLDERARQSNFYRLVDAYRIHGHKQAHIDPLSMTKPSLLPELQPGNFGLNLKDKVHFRGILLTQQNEGTVEEAIRLLNDTYSGTIGTEFSYLETEEEREWFAKTVERTLAEPLDDETRKAIAAEMLKSQAFDNFLAIKFVSLKRYGGEGAESMMAFFHEFFKLCASDSLEHIILCAAHRGRLNLLTGLLKFPPEKLFHKLRGLSEFPNATRCTGDVISHLISSTDLNVGGKSIHFTMLRNPSHLEIVNPVSMGKTRAIMQTIGEGAYGQDDNVQWSDKVINIQVHGDAAYTGQGVNQECLALSRTPHFEIGGTIHLVINNQLGFTTPPSRGRSSRYCTDLAKSISAPVIHVNADNPEMVVRATRIAFKYQRQFRRDVFVDLVCFRRWGHNELDDPLMTNPLMYKIIQNRPSIPDRYADELIGANVLTRESVQNTVESHTGWLNRILKESTEDASRQPGYLAGRWIGIKQAEANVTQWDSGVELSLLEFVGRKSVEVPADLDIYPQVLKSHVLNRLKKIESGDSLDWSTAEALAIGSLLYQGYNVRISGQDVGRGTFAQRHAMIVDQSTGATFIPLNSMISGQTGKLEVANSILSEEAVLGFEYGMSITSPSTLPIWEAQFGDFFNGAQIVIDTYITNGEAKWMLSSGLTMLLPHGYDGAGPEHSSCRLERFLQLTDSKENEADSDDVNVQIANPSEPAQYFHLLRRQMVRNYRKPLIVIAPKILLRHPAAVSSLSDLGPRTSFKNVIGDDRVKSDDVNKVILVSGKHYYALKDYRDSIENNNVAIIRIESLCPFPIQELLEEIEKYKYARIFVWSQEEPRNMGAWGFVKPRFENLCGRQLKYCGRETMAAPAVGDQQKHQREAKEVIVKPFLMK